MKQGKRSKVGLVILAAVLAVFMSLVPMGRLGEVRADAKPYGVWVNGEQFTSEKTEIKCGTGKAFYDAASKTLTLNNATINTKTVGEESTFYIGASSDITIKLIGNNAIFPTIESDYESYYGICLDGDDDLTITGSGNLEISNVFDGIYSGTYENCASKVTLKDANVSMGVRYYGFFVNGTVNIENSELSITSNNEGIVTNDIIFNNSTVDIKSVSNCMSIGDSVTNEGNFISRDSKLTLLSEEDYGIHLWEYYDDAHPDDPNYGKITYRTLTMEGGSIDCKSGKGGTNQSDESKVKLNGATFKRGKALTDTDVLVEATGVKVTVDMDGHADNVIFFVEKNTVLTRDQLMEKVKDVPAEKDGYVFMGLATKSQASYSDFDAYNKDVTTDAKNGWTVKAAGKVTVYGIWFKKISDVTVNVTTPDCGNKLAAPTVTSTTDGCTVSGAWTKDSNITGDNALPLSGTFVGGTTYHLHIDVDNKWGYAFPADGKVNVVVNGGTVKNKGVTNKGVDSDLNVAVDVTAAHSTEKVDAKDATETTPGNKEHYTCKGCNKLFIDKEGTKETTKEEVTIPAKGKTDNKDNTNNKETKGKDGTALGNGASSSLAEKTIVSYKKETDPAGSVYNILQLKVNKVGKNNVQLKWGKAKGAKKYILYGNRCGKKYRKVVETKKTKYKVTKLNKKKLTKGTYYKFILVAVDKNNKVVSTSKTIHIATSGGKLGNDKKVTTAAKKNKVTLKAKKKFKLKAKAVPASKKLKVNKHRNIKYETTNPKVATVSKKGVIKGVKKGTCYVYAYAQDGVAAKIKVTVK